MTGVDALRDDSDEAHDDDDDDAVWSAGGSEPDDQSDVHHRLHGCDRCCALRILQARPCGMTSPLYPTQPSLAVLPRRTCQGPEPQRWSITPSVCMILIPMHGPVGAGRDRVRETLEPVPSPGI
eukprot:3701512-Rhodomonas_salina.5